MTMTTLTREALLNKGAPRITSAEIPGIGSCKIRSRTESQNARRVWQLQAVASDHRRKLLARVHVIIDQLLTDDGQPMFTEDDADDIGELDTNLLDAILDVIADHNEVTEKNGLAGSNGSVVSSEAIPI